MGVENKDFTTASGVPLHKALGRRKSPLGRYFIHIGDNPGILQEGENYGILSITKNFLRIARGLEEDELKAYCIQVLEEKVGAGNVSVSEKGNITVKVSGKEADETHLIYAGGMRSRNHESITAGLEVLEQVLYFQKKGQLKNNFVFQICFGSLDDDSQYDSSQTLDTKMGNEDSQGYRQEVKKLSDAIISHGEGSRETENVRKFVQEVSKILYSDDVSIDYQRAVHILMKSVLAKLI